MRVLILTPSIYSVANTFVHGLEANGCTVKVFDYHSQLPPWIDGLGRHVVRMPYMIRSKWIASYSHRINALHREAFRNFSPDIVLVYNSEMLHRGTTEYFQKRARVVFFMGDSPFFTPVNDEYLPSLRVADLILSPDSFWIEQLALLGINKCKFFVPGSNPTDHHIIEGVNRKSSEIVFFGQPYSGSWGYKRAMFLNSFAGLDLKIYTNSSIKRWYKEFPALEKCVCHTGTRINAKQHNEILNSAWLYPVDANPGLINGVHIRIIDCINSGVIPITEYRKDVEQVFDGTGLPVIKCYSDAENVASELLRDPALYHKILGNLRDFVFARYSPEITMGELLSWIENG